MTTPRTMRATPGLGSLAALAAAMVAPVAATAAPAAPVPEAPAPAPALTPLTLAPAWSDHAVIERDAPVTVAGQAAPHQPVSGQLGEATVATTADAKGAFVLTFPARAASASGVTLVVTAGGQNLTVHDLVVGEVWLCSGQSNMEYPLRRALNGDNEVAHATDPLLRLLQVPRGLASVPQTAFARPAGWAAASPASAADFSAACFVMARELRKALGVPVGAIHASWGGSRLRPWLPPASARALYGAAEMALLQRYATDPLGAVTQFTPQWEAWYRAASNGAQPWRTPDTLTWAPVPAMTGWLAWTGTPLATHATGTVWLRRQITLTAAQAASGARLDLGVVDDQDMTFVNGMPVGNTFGWDALRQYRVPAATLRAGVNDVMVAVTNSYDNGGFVSPPEVLALRLGTGDVLPLADGWRYSLGLAATDAPRPPWDGNGGIGVMHNAMVAPLGPLSLAGVAWYQGESDTATPGYAERLRALIGGWRGQFGGAAHVAVVQLAAYGSPQLAPGGSGMATVRDDQRRVASDTPGVSLVAAIDLGERTDIHPANKQTLGQRLALAARGRAMPMPVDAVATADTITVRFSGIDGGLHAWSGPEPLGIELCEAPDSGCRYAHATVAGDTLRVAADGRPATVVRHAWADAPIINLYDGRAMPVPGFALPIAGPITGPIIGPIKGPITTH